MTDRIGQKLGNYRLVRLLGQGGFADVYLAEHVLLKSLAAIKILGTRLTDELRENFLNEARILAHLTHPHIIRTLEFGLESDGIPFLVMDYAPHGTIRQRHPSRTKVPLPTVVEYLKQVADGLQYAHDRRLIHRDLKPDNLLIGQNNELLLSDFGVAMVSQTTTRSQTAEKGIIGTMAYMAPEQLQGKPLFASDQYALGIIVYEWLCGTRPFQGTVVEVFNQHLSVPPAPLRQHVPELSETVEQVVLTALAKDHRQRFPNVQAFATALEQAYLVGASTIIDNIFEDTQETPAVVALASTVIASGMLPTMPAPTVIAPGMLPTMPAPTVYASTLSPTSIAPPPPTMVAPTLITPATPLAFTTTTAPAALDNVGLINTPVPALWQGGLDAFSPAVSNNAITAPDFRSPLPPISQPVPLEMIDRPIPLRRWPSASKMLLLGLALLVILGAGAFAISAWRGHGNAGIAGTHNSGTQNGVSNSGGNSSGNLNGNNGPGNNGPSNGGSGNNGPQRSGPGSTPTSGSTQVPPTAGPTSPSGAPTAAPTSPPKKPTATPTPTPKPGCTVYEWEMHPDGGTTGGDVFTATPYCGGIVYEMPAASLAYATQVRAFTTGGYYGPWVNFTPGQWVTVLSGLSAGTQFKLQARNSGSANAYTVYGYVKY